MIYIDILKTFEKALLIKIVKYKIFSNRRKFELKNYLYEINCRFFNARIPDVFQNKSKISFVSISFIIWYAL